jgi:RHS repeat-associated protein
MRFALTQSRTMPATLQTLGSVTYESQAFDPNSGRASNICATTDSGSCDGLTANFSYSWDSSSDLTQRADMLNNVTESFCYDILNRVTNYGINGSSCTTGNTNTVKSVSYDPLGNILTKSDVGTYSYGSSAGPHAVTSINTTTGCTLVTPEICTVGGTTNPTYAYDANGNMTSGAGRAVIYNSFNMADSVTQSSHTYALIYDTEHQRLTQTEGTAVTDYLNDPASNVMTERFTSGSTTTWRSYFVADGKTVGERSVTGSTVTLTYFVLDHLGSVAVVTTSTGTVQSQLAYDAWGKMRSPTTGADDEACALPPASPTTRGFTDQEQMEDVCLVNFNARIYDPQIGRFMSADPTTEAPYNLQDLNRYTYVLNNPLSLTDPTGYGGFWGLDLLMNERALVPILRRSPILGSIATIAAAAVCQYFAEAGALCGAAMSAEVQGLETGNIGLAAKTFAISFAEAEAFDAIGDMGLTTSQSAIGYMESAGLHGMVGGLTSVAEGGKFRSGFIAAGLSDLTAPNPNTTSLALGTAVSAVSGGVGSVLGGGKFGNGAVTGAFGYLGAAVGENGGGQ